MKQGSARLGGVDNIHSHFDYVVSPQVKDGILLRLGVDGERDSFGLPPNAPLPNTLQSVNAIIGGDFALSDKILMRAELHPGIYSDFVSIGGSDFDMPLQVGGSYLWSKDFQIIFGMQIDVKSTLPIVGFPGIRWQFADQWVLDAIMPKPRLEFSLNKALTLYAGAEIIGGTYHLNDQFGTNHGHGTPNLPNADFNGNICDFNEDRVGLGFTYDMTPNLKLDVSGGYTVYRDYEIHPDKIGFFRDTTSFHNNLDHGAPYGEIGISGSF
jgi:hypothetical protein